MTNTTGIQRGSLASFDLGISRYVPPNRFLTICLDHKVSNFGGTKLLTDAGQLLLRVGAGMHKKGGKMGQWVLNCFASGLSSIMDTS